MPQMDGQPTSGLTSKMAKGLEKRGVPALRGPPQRRRRVGPPGSPLHWPPPSCSAGRPRLRAAGFTPAFRRATVIPRSGAMHRPPFCGGQDVLPHAHRTSLPSHAARPVSSPFSPSSGQGCTASPASRHSARRAHAAPLTSAAGPGTLLGGVRPGRRAHRF